MENKKIWSGILVTALVLGMAVVGCDDTSDNDTDNDTKTNWWVWMSSMNESNFDATARIRITPNSDDSGCVVFVTGYAHPTGYNWATQVGYDYIATVGKTYKATWKWVANGYTFDNVSIRYAQQKDYKNDSAYEFGTDTIRLTIPTSEETKTYEFTMPDNCFMNFTFFVGEDTGSFKISDFKIEEK